MMDNEKSLINIGELAKPATVLVEKISEAIGGYFKPYQIRLSLKQRRKLRKLRRYLR
jgi:hypothetical protein